MSDGPEAELRQALGRAKAAEKLGAEDRLAVVRAAFDLAEYEQVEELTRRWARSMEGEEADTLQLLRLFSLFFRGAKDALRRETSVDAERSEREPWVSDRVCVALVYDLEDDHGSYQHGREALKVWRDLVPTRLEPGKAKLALFAVTVRGWLRIHPPGIATMRQRDISAVEAALKAWGQECMTPLQRSEHAVATMRVQRVLQADAEQLRALAGVSTHPKWALAPEATLALAEGKPSRARTGFFIDGNSVRNWTAMMNSLGEESNVVPVVSPPNCRLNPHPLPGVVFVTTRDVRASEELGFDYGKDFPAAGRDDPGGGASLDHALPARQNWFDGAIVVDGVIPAPTVQQGLENAAYVAKARGAETQVPWFVRIARCPPGHPAAPGFRVLAAVDVPARTVIGRYAGLLRTGSAQDYGTTAYRFDLPEKFNQNHQRALRNFADVADWTSAAAPGTTEARTLKRADSSSVEATPEALTAMAADVAAGRFAPEAAVPLLQAAAEALQGAKQQQELQAAKTPVGLVPAHYKVAKRGGAIAKQKRK